MVAEDRRRGGGAGDGDREEARKETSGVADDRVPRPGRRMPGAHSDEHRRRPEARDEPGESGDDAKQPDCSDKETARERTPDRIGDGRDRARVDGQGCAELACLIRHDRDGVRCLVFDRGGQPRQLSA